MKENISGILFVCLSVLIAGCSIISRGDGDPNGVQDKSQTAESSPQADPRPYSKELKELRDGFNADKGKVRLITLLSPT